MSDCLLCEEPILPTDNWREMPYVGATGQAEIRQVHTECLTRSVVGNIHHVRGECQYVGHCNHLSDKSYREEALEVFKYLSENGDSHVNTDD